MNTSITANKSLPIKYKCKYEEYKDAYEVVKILQAAKEDLMKSKAEVKFDPVLIGSQAFHHHFPSSRKPVDIDFICDIDFAIFFTELNSNYQSRWSHQLPSKFSLSQMELTVFYLPDMETQKLIKYYRLLACKDWSLRYDIVIVTDVRQACYKIATWPTLKKKTFVLKSDCYLSVAPVEVLEVVKTSHIYHSHGFQKHILDLHMQRRYLDYVNEIDEKLDSDQKRVIVDDGKPLILNPAIVGKEPDRTKTLELLVRLRYEINMKKGTPAEKINLNMSNDDFLEKEGTLLVEKMIKHDDIHELLKMTSVPMYTRIKKDPLKAACSQELWNQLSYEEQIYCVQEECMVLAFERYLLPQYMFNEQEAYTTALQHVCTNITKGWFRKFAVDNYPDINKCPKPLKQLADDIIQDFYRKLNHQDQKSQRTLGGLPENFFNYFAEQEHTIALAMAASMNELKVKKGDKRVEDGESKESEQDEENEEDESDYDYNEEYDDYNESGSESDNDSKQVTKTRIRQWKNIYNVSSHAYHTSYKLPTNCRIFKIGEMLDEDNKVLFPNFYIKVKTQHEYNGDGCVEVLSWNANVVIAKGINDNEGLHNVNLYKDHCWTDVDKEQEQYLNYSIEIETYEGGSDSRDNSCEIVFNQAFKLCQQDNVNIDLLLRIVLAMLNPHMLKGGEQLLTKEIVNLNYQYSYMAAHPWWLASFGYRSKVPNVQAQHYDLHSNNIFVKELEEPI